MNLTGAQCVPPPQPQQEGKLFQLANSLKCAFAAFSFRRREQTVYTGFTAGCALIRIRRGRVKGDSITGGGICSANFSFIFYFLILSYFSVRVAVRSHSKAKQKRLRCWRWKLSILLKDTSAALSVTVLSSTCCLVIISTPDRA